MDKKWTEFDQISTTRVHDLYVYTAVIKLFDIKQKALILFTILRYQHRSLIALAIKRSNEMHDFYRPCIAGIAIVAIASRPVISSLLVLIYKWLIYEKLE